MPDIELPGWEDVIRITPEPSLPLDVQIQLRYERLNRILDSPVPEHAQNVGRFLTFTDNVNDLLNTVAIVGSRWLPLLPRTHPLIAGALTAARLLDMARVLSPFGFVGRAPKSFFETSRHNDPYDNTIHADADSLFGTVSSRALEVLVVGQALETLTGIGLSLGPIVGVINDLLYASPLGPVLEDIASLIDPLTEAALDVLNDSPLAWLGGQTFTRQEHLTWAIGTATAWNIVHDFLTRTGRHIDWRQTLSVPRRPRATTKEKTRAALAARAIPAYAPTRWPIPGQPTQADPASLARALTPIARATIAEIYAEPWPPLEHELLFAALRTSTRRAAETLTPSPRAYREGLSPRARLLASLIESRSPATAAAPPDKLAALLLAAPDLQEATGRAIPRPADLEGWLQRHA